jgi:hypothetical protein
VTAVLADVPPPLDVEPIVRPQHAGHRWVWEAAGSDDPMRLLRDGEPHRWCVKTVGPGSPGPRCGNTDTVAAVQTGAWTSVQRCARHLSGHRIHGGVLQVAVLHRNPGGSR